MNATSNEVSWAERGADAAQIAEWVEAFHRDGYLFLENVLPPDLVAELKSDVERVLADESEKSGTLQQMRMRMFEESKANVRLFDLEPIVSFAEALIAPDCHVVHNNSFVTTRGQGISVWHQDDAPQYLVTDGEPPTNVRLPVLLFTANYYLSDVPDVAHGPTQVIPKSHLMGRHWPTVIEGTEWEDKVVSCLGKAGSVVMFNNQVCHRGAINTSNDTRAITQVSYARRLVGHKYFPFMNYQMPEHIYANANPRLKRLLGFAKSGAYG